MSAATMQVNYAQQQRGMGFIGLIFTLSVLISLVFVSFKVGPVLIEQQKVRLAQESVLAQAGLENKTRSELMRDIQKRLQIDDVDGLDARHITITEQDENWQIRIKYARQVNVLQQLDFVVRYDKTVSANN